MRQIFHRNRADRQKQKGRVAALRALEIDPDLSEAHTAFALIVENFEWDWETAGKEYRRAIELDPNYATAHHWYAEYLSGWAVSMTLCTRASSHAS